MKIVKKFKIQGLIPDKEYNKLPFGRQIEFSAKIVAFKESAKSVHISVKRKSFNKSFKEFLDLYAPAEYYLQYFDDANYKDDSIEVYYKD